MRLAEAQKAGKGGEGVVVAVVDSGVDGAHQDLRGAMVPGRNIARDVEDDDLDSGPHGTGMAVLIAGRGHGDGDGLLGVAPRSKVMSVTPTGDQPLIAEGIRWAVQHRAKVINMSFAQYDAGDAMREAVEEAVAADVVLVAGSGNDHKQVAFPAALPGVIAVGAVDRKNKAASFSNYGDQLDIVAYGTAMTVARPHNRYEVVHGTSDSTALVSGIAALMRARYPDMSAAEVADRLTRTAIDRGTKGRDDYYGYGQVDALAALTAPRTPPSATATAASPAPAQDDNPVAYAPVLKTKAPPPLLFVAVGVLLLMLCLALFMIVRARRKT
ncbi:S8 family peptidase [Actinoplanes sp. NPDC051513]|uniref:S8 family peptidase n=1 Tax=Actinoplanes sp. NPDC051513 TaxID=3363908 RepID=UPI0037876715